MYKRILISDYYQQKNNNQVFFNKQVNTDYHCRIPWINLIINRSGEAYLCVSPAWLPISIGSILDYDNIFDLLNSDVALSIRTSILEGKYTYCNHRLCNQFFSNFDLSLIKSSLASDFLVRDNYPSEAYVYTLPKQIVFDFDSTCNFQCPSCRTELINYNTGPESVINQKIIDKIKKLIIDNITDPTTTIRWAGGEPFISRAYLELWEYIVNTGNTSINNIIQTNGSYLKKKKDLIVTFIPYIRDFRISFDAGTKSTYEKIRVNGNWETLLENCQLLNNLVEQNKNSIPANRRLDISSDFVVQLDNYKEIPEYIDVCTQLGFSTIRLSKLWNWGTWDIEKFKQLNVSDSDHPQYLEFINIIKQYKHNPKVKLDYWKNDIK